jgi:predicted DNA-binding WGR domain protein
LDTHFLFKKKNMNANNLVENHHLYCDNYPSDKVYLVSKMKRPLSDLYDVDFAYGRRGNRNLKGGTKGAALSNGAANAIVNKLINSKLKKGYRYEDKGYEINDPAVVYKKYLGRLFRERMITEEQYDKILMMLESSDDEIQGLGASIIQSKEQQAWEQN